MNILRKIQADFRAAIDRDPAARGFSGALAILLCYPGFKAIVAYRLLHPIYTVLHLKLVARVLSQMMRFFTGVEIHPAAQIGPGFFIDHGHGVVIGETTIIGSNVTLFQGVTLGGTGKETGKRHPTVEDDVVVGAGAKVLGNLVLGKCSKIGAGSVVVRDVPPHCTVVGVPAVVVRRGHTKIDLDHSDIGDPFGQRIDSFQEQLRTMQKELELARAEIDRYRSLEAQRAQEYHMADDKFV